MLGHEVDGFRRDKVRSQYQVALVFAVFFVDQNDHAPGAQFVDNLFGSGNMHDEKSCAGRVFYP